MALWPNTREVSWPDGESPAGAVGAILTLTLPGGPRHAMKKIEAFIRHEALEAIRDRLAEIGLPSMSVSEVKGSGRQRGATEHYRGAQAAIFLRPKIRLEIALDDADVERVIDVILEHAHTGSPGDGKIFVMNLEGAVRVRTAETGAEVLAPHDTVVNP